VTSPHLLLCIVAENSQSNSNGNQALYLTEISSDFAEVLVGLIGEEARQLVIGSEDLRFRAGERGDYRR